MQVHWNLLLLCYEIVGSWASLTGSDGDFSGGTGSTGSRAAGSSDGSRSSGQEGEWRQQHCDWTEHARAWEPPHWGTFNSSLPSRFLSLSVLKTVLSGGNCTTSNEAYKHDKQSCLPMTEDRRLTHMGTAPSVTPGHMMLHDRNAVRF